MENSVLLVRIYLPEIPRVPTTRPSREKKKSIPSRTCIIHSHSFFLSLFLSLSHTLSFILFPSPSFSLLLYIYILKTRKILLFLSVVLSRQNEKNGVLAEFPTSKDAFAFPFLLPGNCVTSRLPGTVRGVHPPEVTPGATRLSQDPIWNPR